MVRKCRNEVGAALLSWTCANCPEGRKKQGDLSEYTMKMFNIRRRKQAGYPFSPNDLTPEEWDDLGLIEEMMNGK